MRGLYKHKILLILFILLQILFNNSSSLNYYNNENNEEYKIFFEQASKEYLSNREILFKNENFIKIEEELRLEIEKIKYNKEHQKKIALTFDDGPSAYTRQVLDILDEYNIKATFFVVGSMIENKPETFKYLVSRGHDIGNHTYNHSWLTKFGKDRIYKELLKTNTLIKEYYNKDVIYFRPPYLAVNSNVRDVAEELGLVTVIGMGDNDVQDYINPEDIIKYTISNLNNDNGVIILHDAGRNVKKLLIALPLLIKTLKDNGYRFVKLDEFQY